MTSSQSKLTHCPAFHQKYDAKLTPHSGMEISGLAIAAYAGQKESRLANSDIPQLSSRFVNKE